MGNSFTWTGNGSSSSASDPNNWVDQSGNPGVPGAGDSVDFPNQANGVSAGQFIPPDLINGGLDVASLSIEGLVYYASGNFDVSGDLAVNTPNLVNNFGPYYGLTLAQGVTGIVGGDLDVVQPAFDPNEGETTFGVLINGADLTVDGNVNLGSATDPNGQIFLENGAQLQIDGSLNINGNAQAAESVADFEIWNSTVTVANGQSVNVVGSLELIGPAAALITNQSLNIGDGGFGSFNLQEGASFTTVGDLVLGQGQGGSGLVTVQDGTLNVSGNLILGFDGDNGDIRTADGNDAGTPSIINVLGNVIVGGGQNSFSTIELAGFTTLNIEAGGSLDLAQAAGSTGLLDLESSATTLETTTTITVGDAGDGEVNLDGNGASLDTPQDLVLAAQSTATADLNLALDTNVTVGGELDVGQNGTATINFFGGGTIESNSAVLGEYTGSGGVFTGGAGYASIDDPGATWTVTNDLVVGDGGFGDLSISDGGALSALVEVLGLAGDGQITQTGGTNTLGPADGGITDITDPDTGVSSGFDHGTLYIGSSAGGVGSYNLQGGSLSAGAIEVTSNSQLSVANATVSTSGNLIVGNGYIAIGDDGAVSAQTVQVGGAGIIYLDAGGELTAGSEEVLSGGKIEMNGGDNDPPLAITIDSRGSVVGYGSIAGGIDDNGQIEASGGTLQISGAVTGSGDAVIASAAILDFESTFDEGVTFTGPGALELGASLNYGGTMAGFGTGDSIELADLTYSSAATATWTQNGVGGTLLVVDGGQSETLHLSGTYLQSNFVTQDDGGNLAIAYVPIVSWTTDISGDWTTAADWTPVVVPGSDDAVLIAAPGTQDYTVTSAASVTVVSIVTAPTATLDLTGGTFTTLSGTGSGSNAGTIEVDGPAALSIAGTVDNQGTIGLNQGDLIVDAQGASLQGSGTLELTDSAENTIEGAGALTNVDSTIAGAGTIGDGLTFDNQALGTIDATGTANPLLINGVASFSNEGQVISTGSAGLMIERDVTNSNTIEALTGSTLTIGPNVTVTNTGGTVGAVGPGAIVDLSQASIAGGTLSATNGGSIDLVTNVAVNGTTINVDGASTFKIDQATLNVGNQGVTLQGGGTLELADSAENIVEGPGTLTNLDDTIAGAGTIGDGLALDNQALGTIDATGTVNPLLINGVVSFSNEGQVISTGGAGLMIERDVTNSNTIEALTGSTLTIGPNVAVTNTGGTVGAVGPGAIVDLNQSSIAGGTLSVTNGGSIDLVTNVAVNGTTINVDGASTFKIDQATLNVGNQGVTLQGGGMLELSDSAENTIEDPGTLTNVDDTIAGAGAIGGEGVTLDNQALGTIDATGVINPLSILAAGFSNEGRVISTGSAGLMIERDVTNSNTIEALTNSTLTIGPNVTVTNTGGTVGAAGPGATVDLTQSSVEGGTLSATNGGLIGVVGSTAVDDVTINVDGASAFKIDQTTLNVGNQGVTLQGGGMLELADSAQNTIEGTGTLTNVDDTIAGAGTIGGEGLTLDNDAGAVIDATGIHPLILNTGANTITNLGLLEAAGGILDVVSAVTGNGSAAISGSGVIDFESAFTQNTSFAAGASGTLRLGQLAPGVNPTISGFAVGDTINLSNVHYDPTGSAGLEPNSDNILQVKENGSTYTLDLDPTQDFVGHDFLLSQDNVAGGTDITVGQVPITGAVTVPAGETASDVIVAAGGQLTVAAGATAIGTTVDDGGKLVADAGSTITNSVIDAGGLLDLATGAAAFGTVTFGPPIGDPIGGTLEIDDTAPLAATIVNFAVGDAVDLAALPYDPNGGPDLLAGNKLTVNENGGTYTLQFDPTQNFNNEYFSLAPDSAGTGTAVTAYTPTAADDEIFLNALYEKVLNRPIDPTGLAELEAQMAAGATAEQIAYEIVTSPEAYDDLVTSWYQQFLGRAPDPNGLSSFVGALSGGATEEQVQADIIGSSEFFNDAGGTNTGFVTALFQDVLGRLPSNSETGLWVGTIQNLELTLSDTSARAQVALEILTSDEHISDDVKGWYGSFLGRAPTPQEVSYFTSLLNATGDQTVIATILGSDEFFVDALRSAAGSALPGYYQPAGAPAPIIDPPGTYTDMAGATAPILAPAGYYDSGTGNTAAIIDPAGTYTGMAGSAAPILAPTGYYDSGTGNTAPTRAPAGYYDPGTGNTAPILLPVASWAKGASGSWQVAANWSTDAIPAGTVNASLLASGTYTVTDSLTTTVSALQIAANATLAITGGVFTSLGGTGIGINAGTIKVGAATLDLDGPYANAATGMVTAAAGATIDLDGGNLSGGQVTIAAGATLEATGGPSSPSTLGGGAALTDKGTLLATDNTVLTLANVAIAAAISKTAGVITGGLIEASDGSATILIGGATITGGALETLTDGLIETVSGTTSTLANTTILAGTTVDVVDGSTLTVSGTLTDAGTLALAAGADATELVVAAGGATLTGGGSVTLSGGSDAILGDPVNGGTLTNRGTTISGYGQIGQSGDAKLTLDNLTGTVDADSFGNTLVIDTGNPITNKALLEATDGGTLAIFNDVANTGGTIESQATVEIEDHTITGGVVEAVNFIDIVGSSLLGVDLETAGGGFFYLDSTTIVGGKLTTVNNDEILILTGSTSTFDGIASAVTNAANVQLQDAATLELEGTIDNTGTIEPVSIGDAITLDINGAVTLSGNGSVVLSNAAGDEIVGDPVAGGTLTNRGNTISGYGQIGHSGDAKLTLDNLTGTVDADSSGNALVIDTGNPVTNKALLEATAGGTLAIFNDVANTGGTIESQATVEIEDHTITGGVVEAVAGGFLDIVASSLRGVALEALSGFVDLSDATITGGSLTTINNDVILVLTGSTSTFDGIASTVTNAANIQLQDAATLTLEGTIDNTGTIAPVSTGDAVTLDIDGAATLSGNGSVVLSNTAGDDIVGDLVAGGTLTNRGNTISGYGQIGHSGDAKLTLDNLTGTVDADSSGNALVIDTGNPVTNKALLEATDGGTLAIFNDVTNTGGTIESQATVEIEDHTITGGVVEAAAGGLLDIVGSSLRDVSLEALSGFVDLNDATIAGGSLTTINNDEISILTGSTSTFNGIASTVTNAANVQLFDAATLTLEGTIDNTGTIAPVSSGDAVTLDIDGAVVLSGNGSVVLSNTAGDEIVGDLVNGGTLTNRGNTISGAGEIGRSGDTRLTLDNLTGTVDADNSGNTLVIDTGNPVTNKALLEATDGGTLAIDDNVNNAGGVLAADGGNVSLFGVLSGSGGVEIFSGSSVTLGSSATDGVTFENNASAGSSSLSSLILKDAQGFSGTVAGLASPDSIDLANFLSPDTSITKITGTGAAGTTTNITLTDADPSNPAKLSVTLHLMNQLANQFGTSASDYSLASDHTASNGTLFQLAAHG